VRPVRVPPTLYLESRLQPMTANPAVAMVIQTIVFTSRLP
jgi:hypothetical protein